MAIGFWLALTGVVLSLVSGATGKVPLWVAVFLIGLSIVVSGVIH